MMVAFGGAALDLVASLLGAFFPGCGVTMFWGIGIPAGFLIIPPIHYLCRRVETLRNESRNWRRRQPLEVRSVPEMAPVPFASRALMTLLLRQILTIWGIGLFTGSVVPADEWRQLTPLPDREGVAAPFAGISHGGLLVAGGANFPGRKPWEGGTKQWYDTVYVLAGEAPSDGESVWKMVGHLPRPLGYGVCVTHGQTVVCVGGSNATQHFAEAFRMEWHPEATATEMPLVIHDLPPLPEPVANACGALVGETLYVAGGQLAPDSVTARTGVHRLDLSCPQPMWETVPPLPGSGRILATAAGVADSFWVIGGAELSPGPDGKSQRRYLTDGYRYSSATGWQRIADLPVPAVAAPSPAPVDGHNIYLLGGDDGQQLKTPPTEHPGFRPQILRYSVSTNRWTDEGQSPAPRVTVPCVPWGKHWVIPSGEARPGVRSPQVWLWRPMAPP